MPLLADMALASLGIQAIDLIEYVQTGPIADAKMRQDLFYFGVLFGVMRVGYVGDMKNQRCLLHFLERGAKSRQQALRQIANEANGIGKQDPAIRRQPHGADRRIERGKHFRGNQHVGAAERIEERRFSGVGVADQGDRPEGHGLARIAAQSALPPQRFNRSPDAPHAFANAAAVGFEFLFAGTSRADAAAQPRKLRTGSGQSRQQIVQLRQFHLQLSLAAARVARKNIQDQLRAIDHAPLHASLQIALLHRSELAVENNQRRLPRLASARISSSLPSAHDARGINGVAHLQHAAGHDGAGAARQFREFLERFAGGLAEEWPGM